MGPDGWLEAYTFPAEAKLSCLDHAFKVYDRAAKRTINCGTTTAVYFGTIDVASCKVLTQACIRNGQRAFVGKVNMDRNCPDFYRETTEESLQGTTEFIEYVKSAPAFESEMIFPVITPRFILTCSTELLARLGALSIHHQVHIQSHISESVDQVEFTKSLHPGEGSDAEIFAKHHLLGSRNGQCLMAHGVHCSSKYLDLMKRHGCAISHCPLSNFYFDNGILDVKERLLRGNLIGLGTDIAGGYSPSMLNAQRTAVIASRSISKRITYLDAFFLSTLGGAKAIGMERSLGSFHPGFKFDALVLSAQSGGNISIFDTDTQEDIFQKLLPNRDDRNITRVWVNEQLLR